MIKNLKYEGQGGQEPWNELTRHWLSVIILKSVVITNGVHKLFQAGFLNGATKQETCSQ